MNVHGPGCNCCDERPPIEQCAAICTDDVDGPISRWVAELEIGLEPNPNETRLSVTGIATGGNLTIDGVKPGRQGNEEITFDPADLTISLPSWLDCDTSSVSVRVVPVSAGPFSPLIPGWADFGSGFLTGPLWGSWAQSIIAPLPGPMVTAYYAIRFQDMTGADACCVDLNTLSLPLFPHLGDDEDSNAFILNDGCSLDKLCAPGEAWPAEILATISGVQAGATGTSQFCGSLDRTLALGLLVQSISMENAPEEDTYMWQGEVLYQVGVPTFGDGIGGDHFAVFILVIKTSPAFPMTANFYYGTQTVSDGQRRNQDIYNAGQWFVDLSGEYGNTNWPCDTIVDVLNGKAPFFFQGEYKNAGPQYPEGASCDFSNATISFSLPPEP